MPQAPSVSVNDNSVTPVLHTLTPMGVVDGWTQWKQTAPTPETPLDGFVLYARVKNPSLTTKDPKAARRTEFKAYWRDTTTVDGVPTVTEQLFAEFNVVAPLTATAERVEWFRALLSVCFTNTAIKEMVSKGYPLT